MKLFIKNRHEGKDGQKEEDTSDGRLNEHTEAGILLEDGLTVKEFVKLGEMNAKSVFDMLAIDYKRLLKCYANTIKVIAGNNVYIDEPSVVLHSINLGIVAVQDIVLPSSFELDVSGLEGIAFAKKQAYGIAVEMSEKATAGRSGDNGLDGLCGENGGHLYVKADRDIVNLDSLASLKFSGGNGASGQMGGIGQKGGVGLDTGDAQAEEFGPCITSPSFVVAFARIPGLDTTTGKFTMKGELSGNGGDAGCAGFGGGGGFPSGIFIKDNERWIKSKKDTIESSDNLKELIEKLKG